jgi:hypothetical protein
MFPSSRTTTRSSPCTLSLTVCSLSFALLVILAGLCSSPCSTLLLSSHLSLCFHLSSQSLAFTLNLLLLQWRPLGRSLLLLTLGVARARAHRIVGVILRARLTPKVHMATRTALTGTRTTATGLGRATSGTEPRSIMVGAGAVGVREWTRVSSSFLLFSFVHLNMRSRWPKTSSVVVPV